MPITLSTLCLVAAAVFWLLATVGVSWSKWNTTQAGWLFILLAYLLAGGGR